MAYSVVCCLKKCEYWYNVSNKRKVICSDTNCNSTPSGKVTLHESKYLILKRFLTNGYIGRQLFHKC